MLVKRCSDDVQVPKRHKEGDAGFDLRSTEEIIIKPGMRVKISTKLAFCILKGFYAQVFSRSGQALRGLVALGGVIDRNYTGEVAVIMHNISSEDIEIKVGERVAQIVFIHIWEGGLKEVGILHDTERGVQGFGSSGKE